MAIATDMTVTLLLSVNSHDLLKMKMSLRIVSSIVMWKDYSLTYKSIQSTVALIKQCCFQYITQDWFTHCHLHEPSLQMSYNGNYCQSRKFSTEIMIRQRP